VAVYDYILDGSYSKIRGVAIRTACRIVNGDATGGGDGEIVHAERYIT